MTALKMTLTPETMPAPEATETWTDARQTDMIQETALAFAQADYRWRLLGGNRQKWTDPDELRTLTSAFLQYHSAKLALEDCLETAHAPALPPNVRLAA